MEKIDLCLIAESHLTKNTNAKISGYLCYHAIHPSGKPRGGATIYARNNLRHYEHDKIEANTMQMVTITAQLNSYKTINIAAIYCPPKYQLKREDYKAMIQKLGTTFIIGGDFNAKHTHWGSRLTNTKGRELLEAGLSSNCVFLSGRSPTYWPADPNKTPDLIDFFISKGIAENYTMVENKECLSSDHSPVILTVSETIIEKEKGIQLTNNRTNWKIFANLIDKYTILQVPIKSNHQIEEELENLITAIQNSAWESTPKIEKNLRKYNSYTEEIRELVREKRKARKVWHTNRITENKRVYNRLKNKLTERIREIKSESINKYLSSLSSYKEDDYSLWKATKGLKSPKVHIPPIRKDNDKWATSPKDKADLFAEHLEQTFQPLTRQSTTENVTQRYKHDELKIKPIKLKELKYEVKHLLAKKSPGYDLITTEIIKKLPEKGLKKMLHIINATIRLRYVPEQWKVAEVIMIPKPNKPSHEKTSYRPISILTVLSKIFEKLLLKRLKPLVENRNLIPTHQFGFREKHSTIEQIHRVTDVIEKALENKKICSAVFLDVAQAFDKVWHEGLEYKLQRDLPKQMYEILKSYIEKRYFRVKHEGEYSDLKSIRAGVPQGSVLGPLLYLIYTNDVPQNNETSIATFADDTAILAVGDTIEESTNKLQNAINEVCNWTRNWRIKLNEQKSTHITFTNQKVQPLPIRINNEIISHANTAKYLGMTLDTKLRWKEHVKIKRKELDIKYRKMYWLIGKRSELNTSNKLLLYRQILKPVWTYGIQLWGCTKKTNVKIIQTFQNKVLRRIVAAPWYIRNDNLHRDLKMESVSEEITKYADKYAQRLLHHENEDIQRIIQENRGIRRLKRTLPLELISEY